MSKCAKESIRPDVVTLKIDFLIGPNGKVYIIDVGDGLSADDVGFSRKKIEEVLLGFICQQTGARPVAVCGEVMNHLPDDAEPIFRPFNEGQNLLGGAGLSDDTLLLLSHCPRLATQLSAFWAQKLGKDIVVQSPSLLACEFNKVFWYLLLKHKLDKSVAFWGDSDDISADYLEQLLGHLNDEYGLMVKINASQGGTAGVYFAKNRKKAIELLRELKSERQDKVKELVLKENLTLEQAEKKVPKNLYMIEPCVPTYKEVDGQQERAVGRAFIAISHGVEGIMSVKIAGCKWLVSPANHGQPIIHSSKNTRYVDLTEEERQVLEAALTGEYTSVFKTFFDNPDIFPVLRQYEPEFMKKFEEAYWPPAASDMGIFYEYYRQKSQQIPNSVKAFYEIYLAWALFGDVREKYLNKMFGSFNIHGVDRSLKWLIEQGEVEEEASAKVILKGYPTNGTLLENMRIIIYELLSVIRWASAMNQAIKETKDSGGNSLLVNIKDFVKRYSDLSPRIDKVVDMLLKIYFEEKFKNKEEKVAYSKALPLLTLVRAASQADYEGMALLIYSGRANPDKCIKSLAKKNPGSLVLRDKQESKKERCLALLAAVCSPEAIEEARSTVEKVMRLGGGYYFLQRPSVTTGQVEKKSATQEAGQVSRTGGAGCCEVLLAGSVGPLSSKEVNRGGGGKQPSAADSTTSRAEEALAVKFVGGGACQPGAT